ncbi:MAG: hypothetical protein ACRD5M_07120 [Candidatus Acidiferrales bacterium]
MKFSGLNRTVASALSLFLLSLLLVGCGQNSQANEKPDAANDKPGLLSRIFDSTKPLTIPEGTDLPVVLNQTISTATNRSGDTFTAILTAPIVVDGKTVIPQDARVAGHVVESVPSGRLKGVARLELTLDSVEVNGKSYDLSTDDEGRRGKNHNKRNAILIGGGAGFGAIVGAIAGGGVGAAVGSAVGAGAGTAGAAYTGKKDIRVPVETALTFRLTRPVTIPVKG